MHITWQSFAIDMKAAVFNRTSAGKVLEIREIEKPVPKPNEVLLKVYAASVNPLDWRLKLRRPGVDLAGVVEAVGASVVRFKPGDAVFGTGRGAFAEYARALERRLTSKPDNMTFEQAASLPIAGVTALQALRDKGHLRAGQKTLINGAAGGVGTFAVQIANSMGADVTGVCSTQNVELVRSLGATRVFDYTREDFTNGDEQYDVILDSAASRSLSDLRLVMTPPGICVIAGAAKAVWPVVKGLLELLIRSIILRQRITTFIARVTPKDLDGLSDLVLSGKLSPVIDRIYPLTRAADAIAYVETGHARAKVVICMNAASILRTTYPPAIETR